MASNHRARVGELDLVMRDGRTLVIVEVRSRTSTRVATPAETIDRYKQRRIVLATQHFILRNRHYSQWPLRFDVVGVTGELDAAADHLDPRRIYAGRHGQPLSTGRMMRRQQNLNGVSNVSR